jgi:hypothetical protein
MLCPPTCVFGRVCRAACVQVSNVFLGSLGICAG